MTNIQAAIGVGQIDCIEQLIEKRHHINQKYISELKVVDGIQFQKSPLGASPICWLFTFTHAKLSDEQLRSQFILRLKDNGIDSRNVFFPLSGQPAFKNSSADDKFNNSSKISEMGISLPTYYELEDADIKFISKIVVEELS